MKILNLYAGLGGNRTLWGNTHEITAVEINREIAQIYRKRFPNDRVVIGNAERFLLEYFPKYDFIWVSPLCKTHSKLMRFRIQRKFEKGYKEKLELPDMKLYSVILFLKHQYKGQWVVENVRPYYKPLIEPTVQLGRHLFWSNFEIPKQPFKGKEYSNNMKETAEIKGINPELLKGLKIRKDGILRDMVNPKIGGYVLNCVLKEI